VELRLGGGLALPPGSFPQKTSLLSSRQADDAARLGGEIEAAVRRRHAIENGDGVELTLGQLPAVPGRDGPERGATLAAQSRALRPQLLLDLWHGRTVNRQRTRFEHPRAFPRSVGKRVGLKLRVGCVTLGGPGGRPPCGAFSLPVGPPVADSSRLSHGMEKASVPETVPETPRRPSSRSTSSARSSAGTSLRPRHPVRRAPQHPARQGPCAGASFSSTAGPATTAQRPLGAPSIEPLVWPVRV